VFNSSQVDTLAQEEEDLPIRNLWELSKYTLVFRFIMMKDKCIPNPTGSHHKSVLVYRGNRTILTAHIQPPGGQAGRAAGTEYDVTRFQGVLDYE